MSQNSDSSNNVDDEDSSRSGAVKEDKVSAAKLSYKEKIDTKSSSSRSHRSHTLSRSPGDNYGKMISRSPRRRHSTRRSYTRSASPVHEHSAKPRRHSSRSPRNRSNHKSRSHTRSRSISRGKYYNKGRNHTRSRSRGRNHSVSHKYSAKQQRSSSKNSHKQKPPSESSYRVSGNTHKKKKSFSRSRSRTPILKMKSKSRYFRSPSPQNRSLSRSRSSVCKENSQFEGRSRSRTPILKMKSKSRNLRSPSPQNRSHSPHIRTPEKSLFETTTEKLQCGSSELKESQNRRSSPLHIDQARSNSGSSDTPNNHGGTFNHSRSRSPVASISKDFVGQENRKLSERRLDGRNKFRSSSSDSSRSNALRSEGQRSRSRTKHSRQNLRDSSERVKNRSASGSPSEKSPSPCRRKSFQSRHDVHIQNSSSSNMTSKNFKPSRPKERSRRRSTSRSYSPSDHHISHEKKRYHRSSSRSQSPSFRRRSHSESSEESDEDVGNSQAKVGKFFDNFFEKLKVELSKSTRNAVENAVKEGKRRDRLKSHDKSDEKLGCLKSRDRRAILVGSIEMINKAFGGSDGTARPHARIFDELGEILKNQLPWEFKHVDSVTLPDGLGKVVTSGGKGKGGRLHNYALVKSLKSMYYERYRRLKSSNIDKNNKTHGRKKATPYGLIPEKWQATCENKEESEKDLNKLSHNDNENAKKKSLNTNRKYIQSRIRNLKTGNIADFFKTPDMKVFAANVNYLDDHFSWVCESENLFNLGSAHIDRDIKMLFSYVQEKQGTNDDIELQFADNAAKIKKKCDEDGNDTRLLIFLVREFAVLLKEDPDLVFQDRSSKNHPSSFPFVANSAVFPGKYSVCQDSDTLYDNLSGIKALATTTQLFFVFNYMYPKKAEKTFDFIQRILFRFGLDTGGKTALKKPSKIVDEYKLFVYKLL